MLRNNQLAPSPDTSKLKTVIPDQLTGSSLIALDTKKLIMTKRTNMTPPIIAIRAALLPRSNFIIQ